MLVAVGAATFVDVGQHLNGNAGATQIIAYVVSGVGFLGAGVIMKEGSTSGGSIQRRPFGVRPPLAPAPGPIWLSRRSH